MYQIIEMAFNLDINLEGKVSANRFFLYDKKGKKVLSLWNI